MSNDQRQAWFARVMESGLENDIFAPSDVLRDQAQRNAKFYP